MRAPGRVWAIAAGAAGFGLLAGHQLNYLLLDEPTRNHVLGSTGHGYLASTFTAASIGVVFTAIVLAAGALATGKRGEALGILPARALAVRLAGLQVAGFVGIELVERAATGSITHHLDVAVLSAGVLAQVAIAFAAAASIRLLRRVAHRVGARIADRLDRLDRAATTIVAFIDPAAMRGITAALIPAPRGPPSA